MKNNDAVAFQCSRDWANQFPSKAGVYSVFDLKKLIYVGESGSLKGRMRDLLDTRNHTLRRRLGSELFNTRHDYFPASTKDKFPETIENLLNKYMSKKLSVLAISVVLGRKEIEEALVASKKPKFNSKLQRST